jgi:1-acyl-sn-glycerol-3-phosphate acyltransferase
MQMQHASVAPAGANLVGSPLTQQTPSIATQTTQMTRQQVLSPTLSDKARSKFWNVCKMPCRLISTLAFDLKSYGLHHVPQRGGALLISNHQSVLDPVLLGVHLHRPISFIAKSELFENPKFSWLIRNLNAFAVRRGQADVAAIKEALHRVKDGQVVTLFPEGTRSRDGGLHPIQPGIAMLVRRADAPVIPAVIDGAFRAWPKGSKLPRPVPIRVMFGAPLQLAGLKGNEIVPLIARTMQEMMDQLRRKKH